MNKFLCRTVLVIFSMSITLLGSECFSGYTLSPLKFYGIIGNVDIPGLDAENRTAIYLEEKGDYGQYSIRFDQSQGEFRRFFDAGLSNDIYWSAYGKKHLTDRQVFSGLFCYRNRKSEDVAWTHNRDSYSAFPFLLADSSVGGFNMRGLLMQVNYANELIMNKLYSGASFFYNVDEDVKDVFPRPQNLHRDMLLDISLLYCINDAFNLGLTVGYFDLQENLKTSKYNQDQEKTPLFFKLRGLDLPLIFRGETAEERLYEINGYSLMLESSIGKGKLSQTDLSGYYENASASSVDGGMEPIEQGTWVSERMYFKVNEKLNLQDNFSVSVFSDGMYYKKIATHPDFDLDMYTETRRMLSGGINACFGQTGRFQTIPAFKLSSNTLKRLDTFNGIVDYFPGTLAQFSLKMNLPEFERWNYSVSVGGDIYTSGDSQVITTEETGFIYNTITSLDEAFYSTDYMNIRFLQELSFGKNREYTLELKYIHTMPQNSDYFNNHTWNQLQVNLIIENFPALD